MANRDSLAAIYAVLLQADDDISLKEILARCTVPVRPPVIASTMYQMVKRGHASVWGKSPKRFAITPLGRRSIDILEVAKISLQRPKKTLADIDRDIAGKAAAIPNETNVVAFPRAELRLLASAALASAKPLDDNLRNACLAAVKAAA